MNVLGYFFVLSHIKNMVLVAFALLFILAGFYSSTLSPSSSSKTTTPMESPSTFERQQCALYEQALVQRVGRHEAFLKRLISDWEGPFRIESLKLTGDEWEVVLHTMNASSSEELPAWFVAESDLIQLRRCLPGKGCWHTCRLYLSV